MSINQDDLDAIGDQIPKVIARRLAINALAAMLKRALGPAYDLEVAAAMQAARDIAAQNDPDLGREVMEELEALLSPSLTYGPPI